MKKDIYYKYFNEHILPKVIPFEQERIKTVKKVILSSFLFFTVGIIFAALFILNAMYEVLNPLVLPIFLFLMYTFIIKSIVDVILAGVLYKKQLLNKILPLFLEPVAKFQFWPEKDFDTILNSKLFGNFDELEENLCIFGLYNDTTIRISDTSLILPVKNSEKTYLFKGTMIKLELPKSFKNHIVLLSKNLSKVNKYKQFNPNIQELNNYLYCFAKNTDNVNLVTPEFWQTVKKFGEIYIAKSFSMSVNDNVVLIALKQKKPMQFGFLFKSLLKPKNYDELIDRFTIVFDLVDLLNN